MNAARSEGVLVSGVRFSIDAATGREDAVVWRHVDPNRKPEPYLFELTSRSCEVRIESTSMLLERGEPHSVRIHSAAPLSDQGLIHPYLSLPAAVIQHWNGRVVLHASAFDLHGRTVVLLGDREAGKSTTVAAALAAGLPVRADDVVVLDGTDALPGTSLIDLRESASTVYGGQPLGRIGSRERWRIPLDPVTESAPVAAFVRLSWGESVHIEPLPGSRLLSGLYAAAAVREAITEHLATNPSLMMDLLSVPYFDFQRPRDLNQLRSAVDELCEVVAREP
jgi:hypothetical protein